MRAWNRRLIVWLALPWSAWLGAEAPPSVSGSLSMKVSEYEILLNGEHVLQRETAVDPLVITDPDSKTGYSISEGEDRDERGLSVFAGLVAGSTNWETKLARQEMAPKLKELGDLCGPAGRITAMTTPAPEAIGIGGRVAMHFKMVAVRGCTEAGVYSEAVNSKRKGVDCFVDREDERFAGIVKEPCCFDAADFNRFLNQCIADLRAYKQQRGLLPTPR